MTVVRTVCAHDCPDTCSLLVHVENDTVVRVEGDPGHGFTAGFACGKVNRDAELVHSPERLTTPLRRQGPKGAGQFVPMDVQVEFAVERQCFQLGWVRGSDSMLQRWRRWQFDRSNDFPACEAFG